MLMGIPLSILPRNGAAYDDIISPDGMVDDHLRIGYLESYLAESYQAVKEGLKYILLY
jgi:beta-glucosidase